MKLRPYQAAVMREAQRLCGEGKKRLLFPMATGLGKTAVFTHLPQFFPDLGKQGTVILVHREELVRQTVQALKTWHPDLRVGVEKGQQKTRPDQIDVLVASFQTLGRKQSGEKRLEKFKGFGGIVIVDEAHHLKRYGMYDRVLDGFGVGSKCRGATEGGALLAGFTATPNRNDGASLGHFFDHFVSEHDLAFGIQEGYLVDIMAYIINSVTDLNGVAISKGDFLQSQLSSAVNNQERNTAVVKSLQKLARHDKIVPRAIIFCASVEHAHDLATALTLSGYPSEAIDGTMGSDERKDKLRRFEQGELTALTNYGVLTEGFDAPHCNTIVMCRPTLSPPLYMQMLGRGTRPYQANLHNMKGSQDRKEAIAASPKPHCRVVDFVDNCSKHGVVSMASALGLEVDADEAINDLLGAQDNQALGMSVGDAFEALREYEELGGDLSKTIGLKQLRLFISKYRLISGAGSSHDLAMEEEEAELIDLACFNPGDKVKGVQVTVDTINVAQASAVLEMRDNFGNKWLWRTSRVTDSDKEAISEGGSYIIRSATVLQVDTDQGHIQVTRCKLQPGPR
ncbi:unnamed protein product [Chrysoparadoxa australica]